MIEKISEQELNRLKEVSHRGRSDLYRYLYKNYPELIALGFGTSAGPTWKELAATAQNAGMKGRMGNPPTISSIRRIFANVIQDRTAETKQKLEMAMRHGHAPIRLLPIAVSTEETTIDD